MRVPSQIKQVTKALVSVTTLTCLLPLPNTMRAASQTEKKDKDSSRKSSMESKETVSLEAPSKQHKGDTWRLRQGWACGGGWGLQQCAFTLTRRMASGPLSSRNCRPLYAGL